MIGSIISKFEANFKYGSNVRSGTNPKTGKFVHKFTCQIQVVFGDKGNNLMFKNLVDGNVVSTAEIEFDQR